MEDRQFTESHKETMALITTALNDKGPSGLNALNRITGISKDKLKKHLELAKAEGVLTVTPGPNNGTIYWFADRDHPAEISEPKEPKPLMELAEEII